jgi:hypothetical protein
VFVSWIWALFSFVFCNMYYVLWHSIKYFLNKQKMTYRYSIMHDWWIFIIDVILVHLLSRIFIKPNTHARFNIFVHYFNVVIPVWQLMFMDQTKRVTNFMEVKSFLKFILKV